jgi:hypothetical protein
VVANSTAGNNLSGTFKPIRVNQRYHGKHECCGLGNAGVVEPLAKPVSDEEEVRRH